MIFDPSQGLYDPIEYPSTDPEHVALLHYPERGGSHVRHIGHVDQKGNMCVSGYGHFELHSSDIFAMQYIPFSKRRQNLSR